jgi:hypothetical protein
VDYRDRAIQGNFQLILTKEGIILYRFFLLVKGKIITDRILDEIPVYRELVILSGVGHIDQASQFQQAFLFAGQMVEVKPSAHTFVV